MADATERWLPVVRYEGIYEVSDRGRVRRVGAAPGATVGRILWAGSATTASPYRKVRLSRDGVRKTWNTHLLVLEAFVGLGTQGHQCNHKDGNKTNNHLSNLEWVTPKANSQHAVRTGLMAIGERNPQAKLTAAQVAEIRQLQGIEHREVVAARYGISRFYVNHLWAGTRWKHVL